MGRNQLHNTTITNHHHYTRSSGLSSFEFNPPSLQLLPEQSHHIPIPPIWTHSDSLPLPTHRSMGPLPSHSSVPSKTSGSSSGLPLFPVSLLSLPHPFHSDREEDYTIGPPIGFGASSIVYLATFQPRPSSPSTPPPAPISCALKVLDLDALPPRSLSLLQRETNLMSLSKHPNVLRVRGSWMTGHKLFIALRLMNKGSAADVMRYGWPGGMEEDVIICILRQALQGLK
jgi:hypothetical protein